MKILSIAEVRRPSSTLLEQTLGAAPAVLEAA